MKKILSIVALTAVILLTTNNANAQNISFSINIGTQPAWGPVGYDYVDYYYFPDFNGYYDINNGMFIYFDRGRWITARYLPAVYRHFDLYNIYKVALNVHKPWLYNNRHIKHYKKYRNYHGHQVVIRDSRDKRYHKSRTNYRPWAPDRHDKYDYRPHDNKPNNSFDRPNVNNNRPNNRPNNKFERPNVNSNRPQNNKPESNRPNYSKENNKNNKNNSRPRYENKKENAKSNNSSRPSYNSNNKKNNDNRSKNQSSKSQNSKNDSRRSTYYQTRF